MSENIFENHFSLRISTVILCAVVFVPTLTFDEFGFELAILSFLCLMMVFCIRDETKIIALYIKHYRLIIIIFMLVSDFHLIITNFQLLDLKPSFLKFLIFFPLGCAIFYMNIVLSIAKRKSKEKIN